MLSELGERLGVVPREVLERAIKTCGAENMRSMDFVRAGHVRAAKVGDSRDRLNDAHLAVFREHYADLIRSLGYAVR